VEVVLVEHPPVGQVGAPTILGRSTDPDLIDAARVVIEENAHQGLVYLERLRATEAGS
jgi:hypothetical protein